MATTVTSTSNYSGKEAGVIIGKSFKETNSISSNFITLVTNVNFKMNLRLIEVTGGRRAYTCGFVPDGSIVLSEKVLEPIKFKDDFEVCLEDFRNQWDDGGLGESAWNDGDMKLIMDAILAEKLAQEAEALDANIWTGDNSDTTEFDGFLTLFDADADIIRVLGTTVTMANVETELMKALSAIPASLQTSTTLKIGVSANIFQALSFLYISKGILNGMNGSNADVKAVTIPFGGYTIVQLSGLPANTMVLAEQKNLIMATGSQADFNEIRMVNTNETLLDGKVRGSMVYNAGVGYYNADEIVWYTTDNTLPSV
jgi:hypothetical protein